jgi:ubiquinone/menaquinone biosynthesis C-methylase UbiE
MRVSTRKIDSIDWEDLWKDELERSRNKNAPPIDWDERAVEFERQYSRSDYRDKMLERVYVRPDFSVLDVGCGPGNLAVPLAARARSVTALDMSKEMLRLAKQEAAAQHRANITFSHFNWGEVVVGKDIEPHDVVICSRAFANPNPKEALFKLDQAAKRYVYLTLSTNADEARVFYSNLYKEIGKDYLRFPDYIYAYNLLYQAGILAHVDFIDYTDSFRYDKAEDAYQVLNSHIQAETQEQEDKLMSYIIQNAEKNRGFKLDIKCKWALLWWQKDGMNHDT